MKNKSKKKSIKLNAAEIQSGSSRLNWAEELITQLLPHQGAFNWLLNYGKGETAKGIRKSHGVKFDKKTQSAETLSVEQLVEVNICGACSMNPFEEAMKIFNVGIRDQDLNKPGQPEHDPAYSESERKQAGDILSEERQEFKGRLVEDEPVLDQNPNLGSDNENHNPATY